MKWMEYKERTADCRVRQNHPFCFTHFLSGVSFPSSIAIAIWHLCSAFNFKLLSHPLSDFILTFTLGSMQFGSHYLPLTTYLNSLRQYVAELELKSASPGCCLRLSRNISKMEDQADRIPEEGIWLCQRVSTQAGWQWSTGSCQFSHIRW